MGLIRLQAVTKQFGGRVILNEVTLELATGEVIGLVGPNGVGKTTLFRLIAGQSPPDSGSVTLSRDLQIGYLPQEPQVGQQATLHDEVLSAFEELLALERRLHDLSEQMAQHHDGPRFAELSAQYDRTHDRFVTAGGYTFEQRLREILGGLGFAPEDYGLPMTALSGGQKCRAALAKLLLQDAQFLLLDEPTNHLDIDAVRWLEKFLAGHHGGALVVSHDRYLLDRIATRILELERAAFSSYPGNYTAYVRAREVRRLSQARQYEQDRAFIEKERDYIARYKAGQRAAQAQGRRKRLERMIEQGDFVLERPGERRSLGLSFVSAGVAPPPGDRDIFEAAGLAKRYGAKCLFENLDVRVAPGMRLGITGPNGTGKSTLLKVLLGRLTPDAGTVRVDPRQVIGYYAQDSAELDAAGTLFDEIREARPDWSDEHVRGALGRFLFSGEDAFKPVTALSGGEQSRLRLLKLILAGPTVLVLDEPTNHLDIPSREVLEEALAEFPGALVVVSHDRYFLDRVVNRLLVMRPGQCRFFHGNYSAYIEEIEREAAAASAAASVAASARQSRPSGKPAAAGKSRPAAARSSPFARLSLQELEARIIAREEAVRGLSERFGDPAVCADPAELARLTTELAAVREELAALEGEWEQRLT